MKYMARTALLVAAVLVLPAARAGAQDSGIAVGEKAPGAAVETLAGAPANVASVFGRGPVVLEFWATWCPNCKELEPSMVAMEKKYAGKVTFVGVAVSVNQSPRAVQAYVDRHALPATQFFDTHGKAVGAYDVPATSFVVVVNKAGRVVYTGLGGRQDLEAAIRKAF